MRNGADIGRSRHFAVITALQAIPTMPALSAATTIAP
jgi:hypothetical protein